MISTLSPKRQIELGRVYLGLPREAEAVADVGDLNKASVAECHVSISGFRFPVPQADVALTLTFDIVETRSIYLNNICLRYHYLYII